MSTYVILFQFTEQGIENIQQSPDRVEAAKNISRELGGEVKDFYALLGHRYDTLFILEAPDDETAARISATIGKQGNVRSETLRAFSETEFRKIVGSIK